MSPICSADCARSNSSSGSARASIYCKDELPVFVSSSATLFDLNVAEDTCIKPNIGQSNVREPFPDFTDCADDFRQTNSVVEQFGDLTGTREVAKAEMAIALVQQAEPRKLVYHGH